MADSDNILKINWDKNFFELHDMCPDCNLSKENFKLNLFYSDCCGAPLLFNIKY